ncbi:MAG: aminotransferase class IV [Proteobacteria bacterium]|nr:aminotransferase class IV [Pseudomonadota bacterium]
MTEKILYVNGEFVEEDKATISPFNRGFLYGDGLFETVRSYKGRLFALEDHFLRMEESAAFLRIPLPFDFKQLQELLQLLLKKNKLETDDGRVRINLARGGAKKGLFAEEGIPSELVITVEAVSPGIERIQREGVKLAIIHDIRIDSRSPLSSHKTFNYIPGVLGLMQVEAAGGDEGVFLSYEGNVIEGVTSNIFMVKEGRLFTPPLSSGLLPGITRKKVIEVAQAEGFEVSESDIGEEELFAAHEIFITSSVREVVPVVALDGKTFQIGAVTRAVQDAYKNHLREVL